MKSPLLLTTALISGAALSYAQAPAPATPAPSSASDAVAPDQAQGPAKPASPGALTEKQLLCRASTSYRYDPDSGERQQVCHVTFPAPATDDDCVGVDATPAVDIENGSLLSAIWLSRTSLQAIVKAPSAPDVATLNINPDFRGPKGEVFRMQPLRVGGEGISGIIALHERGAHQPVFVYSWSNDADEVELLAKNIHRMVCRTDEETPRDLPVHVRPATRGDVLRSWDMLTERSYAFESCDRALFAAGAADEELRGLWIVDLPDGVTDTCMLVIPNAGSFGSRTGSYEDTECIVRNCASDFSWLSNRRLSPGEYEVELLVSSGVEPEKLESEIPRLKWSIGLTDEDETQEMVYRDGAFRAVVAGQEITLRPDFAATREAQVNRPMPDGSVGKLCTRLIFKVGPVSRHLTLAAGADGSYVRSFNSTAHETILRPRTPRIRANATLGTLTPNAQGDPKLSCLVENIDRLNVRVIKLDSSPQNAVRVMRAYRNYYSSLNDGEPNSEAARLRRYDQSIVPTELLPGQIATAEKHLSTTFGKAEMSLRDLFADAAPGDLYFVEFRGDAASDGDPENEGDKALTQGMVQLTNLGLMWKNWPGHLMVYAYRLSDGKPLQEGTLRLLDAEGNSLSEHTIRNGVAEVELNTTPSYLQVSCGRDSYVTDYSSNADRDWNAMASENLISDYRIFSEIDEEKVALQPPPITKVFAFTDRRAYRPGEMIHMRGYVRDRKVNELSVPKIKAVTIRLAKDGVVREVKAQVEEGGAFNADFPASDSPGLMSYEINVEYEGDADNSSELMKLAAHYVNPKGSLERLRRLLLETVRRETGWIDVKEFRRNEFEIESELKVDDALRLVSVSGKATNYNTTPVAGGRASWLLSYRYRNFYPADFRHYRFGDYSSGSCDAGYCETYYGISRYSIEHGGTLETKTELDDNGCGDVKFTLPATDRLISITSELSVSNGNRQVLTAECRGVMHPSSLYVGLREGARIVRVGEGIPVHCLLVDTEGKAWKGEPIIGSISVKRESFSPYRIGNRFLGQVRRVKLSEDLVKDQPIKLSGEQKEQPDFVVETPRSGIYLVTVKGTDAQGRPFRSVMRYSVYGDGECPWYYDRADEMNLFAESDLYKAGETAKLLFEGPSQGELFVTVEREGVLRSFRQKITPENPVIELPLKAEDAPGVRVTALLVQGAETMPSENGTANIVSASCELVVLPVDRILDVELTPPSHPLLPDEECNISGVVKDASGQAVPNAAVTLYAVDEGTLQVHGYSLPDPQSFFCSNPRFLVETRNSRNQLIGEALSHYDYGNKGVFIGGGDAIAALDDGRIEAAKKIRIRENFTPCALWLGSIRTDQQGQFSATYRNPDTLTRYRVFAVAASGADQFGRTTSAYEVNQPVMLEPQVPMAAAQGDKLYLPVTVSMLPDQIPGLSDDATVRFRLTAESGNAVAEETAHTVELTGNKPVTVTMPVHLPQTGTAALTWTVQPADEEEQRLGEQAKRMRDAVKLSFPVEPARPWLREYFTTSMQPGMVLRPQDFVTLKFKPGTNMKIHFSTHPLAAAAGSLDYLFRYPYGCTEQLSSALLPWLLADDLKDLPGFSLPEGDKPDKVIAKTLAKIRERRVTPGRVSGFRYWEGSRGASAEFTPYVLMVLQVAEKHGYRMNDLEKSMLDSLGLAVRGSDAKGNMISLLPLALSGKLSSSKLDEVLKTHQAMQEDAIWMAACAAAIIGDPRAASLADRARAAHDKPEIAPGVKGRVTPTVEQLRLRVPCEVLSLLYRHYSNPDDAALLTDAATVLRERSRGYMSTWECGWNCILIDALLDHQRALSAKSAASAAQTNGGGAALNGQQLRPGELLSVDASLYLSEGDYKAEGGTVYAYGTAEGYMADEQPDQPIDHGFATTRSYEVLQEDGSWKPTLQFRVGDIVRISIRCRYTGEAPARYVAIEDRLPAVMEAVDQSSPTQALPAHIMNKARRNLGWYAPYSVSSSEIGKDRMRFYVDKWGESDVTIRYVARVVRAGEVTAPAAKAEMMYSPQFYGLSTPEKLSVEPVK